MESGGGGYRDRGSGSGYGLGGGERGRRGGYSGGEGRGGGGRGGGGIGSDDRYYHHQGGYGGGNRYENLTERPSWRNNGGGYGYENRPERASWRSNDGGDRYENRTERASWRNNGGGDRYDNRTERASWRNSGGGECYENRTERTSWRNNGSSVRDWAHSDGGGRGAADGRIGSAEGWRGDFWRGCGTPRSERTMPSPSRQPTPSGAKMPSPDSLVPVMKTLSVASEMSPLRRPDKGGTNCIRRVRLLVNHFHVRYGAESVIMHYNVDIKPEIPPKHGRPARISKSDLSMIRDKFFSDNPSEFPLLLTAYDGERSIFSAVKLPMGNFKVDLSNEGDEIVRSYEFNIKLVNELKLGKLKEYLCGCLTSIPRDILQGMDVVMKENPTRRMISVDRSFYFREPDPRDDLGRGISAFKGFQHSLKPTSQGLSLCLDYSVLVFRKRMPVLDFLREHISRFNLNEFWKSRREIENALKGLKVCVNHRYTKQKFVVRGLAKENARDSAFRVEDPNGQNPPRMVFLVDFFREKYGKNIVHMDIPCLDLGKNNKRNDVPMEFCEILEGQRLHKEHLDKDVAQNLKQMSLIRPNDRRNKIQRMIESLDGPCGGGIAKNFGIEVDMDMTAVEGRVIGPPELKLSAPNGKLITVTVDREKCQWNLVGKFFARGKPIERWAVLDFRREDRRNNQFNIQLNQDPDAFIPKLISRCQNLGIRMGDPVSYQRTSMDKFSSVELLSELLEGISEQVYKDTGGSLQLLVCVMTKRDPGYKYLKWISETKIGIVTQCCLSNHANKANDQFLANLALKINAKLGGSNVELNGFPISTGADHVMFVGADVNHPTSKSEKTPSIAAVVATMNWPAANRYAARVRAQAHQCEKILDFGGMCLELIGSYAQMNNVRPEKIIIFRDGVSEGQFDMVLHEELVDLKRAFSTINYSPCITLIVAQKRHQTRLFPQSSEDASFTGNVPPGTVVDTTVVHSFEFDFYLCSHYGSLGTSKPTHYRVLYDEHGFTSDQLQKLIYDMCFTMARCTKPVSLVPPVYYADLVAYRGRLYHEALTEGKFPRSAGSSSSSMWRSSSSAASTDERFFKLHADLENEMFFV